jgi:hypothetical protein
VQLSPALAKFREGFAIVMRNARGMIYILDVKNDFLTGHNTEAHVEFGIC